MGVNQLERRHSDKKNQSAKIEDINEMSISEIIETYPKQVNEFCRKYNIYYAKLFGCCSLDPILIQLRAELSNQV